MKGLKRFFALATGCVLACSLLAACGGEAEHTHTFKQTWTTSETQHWHEATCGHDVKNALGDHIDAEPKDGKCDVCGYEMETEPQPVTPDRTAGALSDAEATLSLTGSLVTGNEEKQISSDLFGLFLEDINYASQALDDNLIANGSFETTSMSHTYGWTGDGVTLTAQTGEEKLYETNKYFAKLNIQKAGGKLINAGFTHVPMYVSNGKQYKFSAFFRDYVGAVTVRAAAGSTVYAEKTFSVSAPADSWVKYEQTFAATRTGREDVQIEISFAEADTNVLLDAVQFETLDATAGIKNYLYDVIADLAPKFFRFPGGCVIEGTTADGSNAYDWKNSVGAVKKGDDDVVEAFTYTVVKDDAEPKQTTTYGEWATRTPNTNIWKRNNEYYDHEYGIGFYEYFLLCDSLGAKAIPIVNCGYSCQTQSGLDGRGYALNGRHGNKVNDFIQDAIDLIEFAKGDETTEWGKIRKEMGHPKPFEMDYIGIGNEQWGDYYTQYYEVFLQNAAFKATLAKYNVQPIVGNLTLFQHCENPSIHSTGAAQAAARTARTKGIIENISDYGVVDQHYYVNYTDFLGNTDLYDEYTRPGDEKGDADYYNVFVGEYAVNSQNLKAPTAQDNVYFNFTNNSGITALAEAAMMTGFERNGDIVKLAAYAPMFGVANTAQNPRTTGDDATNQWAVDMMYFTGEDVVLTPNYYVQQLFMKNAGDYKISSSWTGTKPKTTYTPSRGSTTSLELDDIFFVTSADKETGDVIVKIVNAGDKSIKLNVDFKVSNVTLDGLADLYELQCGAATTINTLVSPDEIETKKKVVLGGFTEGSGVTTIGHTVSPFSVTVIRLHTK